MRSRVQLSTVLALFFVLVTALGGGGCQDEGGMTITGINPKAGPVGGDQTITIDTSGPWPAGPRMRAVAPSGRDAVEADLGAEGVPFGEFELRVTSAFVRDGLAVVVIDASTGFRGVPGESLALGAELRAGRRVLCARSSLLGEDSSQQSVQGLVLSCPTRRVPELTVAVGVGASSIPLEASLRP